MHTQITGASEILPRKKWWWLGLALLLLLAGWLYLRGYNVSLPFIQHHDEAHHLLAAQHTIDFGHARGVFHDAYPPGTKTLAYIVLKHFKPVEANHGAMLPALRLITITAWMLVIIMIALLGAMMVHPLTGLMAAAIWIVNPWIVDRAHFFLPDGYLTLFTLLALWLALAGCLHRRRSFSTAAVYSIMLAIVFKTQAAFVAPIVIFLPLLNWRRMPDGRRNAWRQTFWNCLRFAVFLFWLLLIYPTLEVDSIMYFPTSYSSIGLPSLESAWVSLRQVLRTFQSLQVWLLILLACGLLWRFRQRANAISIGAIVLAGLAWLLGMSMFNVRSPRHYFTLGAMLALLYGVGLSCLVFLLDEAFSRLIRRLSFFLGPAKAVTPAVIVLVPLAISLLPSYQASDAMARYFSLPDRRVALMRYMDTSLPPGKFITERSQPQSLRTPFARYLGDREYGNHKTFNRSWGGYDGVHDYPVSQDINDLVDKPLATWRAHNTVYAIMPYEPLLDDPDIYYPDETVTLKKYPTDPNFHGPSMVIMRLYPMQNQASGQLGPIHLVGYDISANKVQAGGEIVFRHYWQAEAPTGSVQFVFNHLLDDRGEIVAQVDYVPLWDARRPTTTWDDPDEILLGREFTLPLPADIPPGEFHLVSGFYNPESWQRLNAPDGSDRIKIASITIRQPAS